MTSTRLPGKVVLPLAGEPLLLRVIERSRRIPGVDVVCVAAPEGAAHDAIEAIASEEPDVVTVRGPEDDVLRRYRIALDATGAARVVRTTADCPLFDPAVSGAVLALARASGLPLATTALESGYPVGLDTEVVSREALCRADAEARDPYEREHVTPFLWRRPGRFPFVCLDRTPDLRSWRLAVDTPEDYELVARIYEALHPTDPEFGFEAVEALLAERPEWLAINAGVVQRPLIASADAL